MFPVQGAGFTLVELIIVLVIVAILAGIALPNFMAMKERTLGREAIASLRLMIAANRVYRMESGFYYPFIPAGTSASENDATLINNNLRLSLTENNWDYSILSSTLPCSNATAIRSVTGCIYTLNTTSATGEPEPSAACP